MKKLLDEIKVRLSNFNDDEREDFFFKLNQAYCYDCGAEQIKGKWCQCLRKSNESA